MRALVWWLVPVGATVVAAVWVSVAAWWRRTRGKRSFESIEDVERFRRALARPDVIDRPPRSRDVDRR